MTTNIGIIQRTSLFWPFNNAKQPQIYIQDKAWWYSFKINCITGGIITNMESPGGQKPTFWQKITKNIGSIQRTFLFGPFVNAKQQQIYIQDKAWCYLFKINYIKVGGNPIHGYPGGSKPHILTKNDHKYWYYPKNFPIWTLW